MRSERMPKVLVHLSYLCSVHLGIVLFNMRTLVVLGEDGCGKWWGRVGLLCSVHLGSNNHPTADRRRRSSADENEPTSCIIGQYLSALRKDIGKHGAEFPAKPGFECHGVRKPCGI